MSTKLKLFVNNHEMWTAFNEEFDRLIHQEQKTLEQLKDPVDIYRTQGLLAGYRNLKKLRDRVNG